MCRFVAYLGKKPVILKEILDNPENSLINQSRQAREGKLGLNADGFGIGWYEHAIDNKPGLFKSIQPAWNDQNLRHIASKVRSTCFVGHVRASTIGDVNTFNCHPFSQQEFLFVHNGTILGFDTIKRKLLSLLSDDQFDIIKGQTDSEYFFSLLMDILAKNRQPFTLHHALDVFLDAIKKINQLQKNNSDYFSKINTVLTNGKQMIATRYVSTANEEALSLYYTIGSSIDTHNGNGAVMQLSNKAPGAILIASEPLTDYVDEWNEVPVNHALLVDAELNLSVTPISVTD